MSKPKVEHFPKRLRKRLDIGNDSEKLKALVSFCDPTSSLLYSYLIPYWLEEVFSEGVGSTYVTLSEFEDMVLKPSRQSCEKVYDLLQRYDSLRVRGILPGKPKRVLRGKSFEEVERIVEENWVDEKIDDSGVNWNRIYRNGDKRIYKDGTFEVYKINSANSAHELGKGTQWCFKGSDHAREYAEILGPLYIVLKNGERFCAVHFSSGQWKYPWNDKEIKESDFKELKPIFEQLGIFHFGIDILHYIPQEEVLAVDRTGRWCCQFAENVDGANISFLQQAVIDRDISGEWCYRFAEYVEGADIPLLQQAVIEKDFTGKWCYLFAAWVKGVYSPFLQQAVLDRDSTGKWCYWFAKDVPNLTDQEVNALMQGVIKKDQTGEWCYEFAKWVRGLTNQQKEVLYRAVKERGH